MIPLDLILLAYGFLFGLPNTNADDFIAAARWSNCTYWYELYPGVPKPASCSAP